MNSSFIFLQQMVVICFDCLTFIVYGGPGVIWLVKLLYIVMTSCTDFLLYSHFLSLWAVEILPSDVIRQQHTKTCKSTGKVFIYNLDIQWFQLCNDYSIIWVLRFGSSSHSIWTSYTSFESSWSADFDYLICWLKTWVPWRLRWPLLNQSQQSKQVRKLPATDVVNHPRPAAGETNPSIHFCDNFFKHMWAEGF